MVIGMPARHRYVKGRGVRVRRTRRELERLSIAYKLEELIETYADNPRRDFIDKFLESLKSTKVIAIIGVPGSGKTQDLAKIALNQPRPITGFAFTRADMAELRHRLGIYTEEDVERLGIDVKTFHAVAVDTVGKEFMVGYAIEVPGTKRKLGNRVFIDIALAQEKLRRIASIRAGYPYSLDVFTPTIGNLIFHAFDMVIHTRGFGDLDRLFIQLEKIKPGLSLPIKLYMSCIEGRRGKLGDITCRPAHDFTTILAQIKGSSLPVVNYNPVRTILIDEFQDWSPYMLYLLSDWVRQIDILVIAGDPDQVVYHSLHGSSKDPFMAVIRGIEQGSIRGEVITLNKSHRVMEPINRFATNVLRRYTKPQNWDDWVGKKDSEPRLYIKSWRQVRDEIVQSFNNNKLFILAPVNAAVLFATRSLLKHGLLPLFFKDVPAFVTRSVLIARRVVKRYIEDGGSIFGASVDDVASYMPRGIGPETARFVVGVLAFTIKTANFKRLRAMNDLDALEDVLDSYLNPLRMTYYHNPSAPVYVDTIYAVKGLEADHVVILNWDVKRREINEYLAMLWYVALTRSKGSITIVPPPLGSEFRTSIPMAVLIEEAEKAGVKVVNNV
jgi:hypothetical protein